MRLTSPTHLRLIFTLALVAAVTVGCFRSGGDDTFESTPVARAIPTLTPTHTELPPTPTETPEPTETPFGFDDSEEESDPFGADNETDELDEFSAEGTAVAQEQFQEPTQELDPLILEATQAIIRQTQIFLDQTATAQASFIIPTETFTPDPIFATDIPPAFATDVPPLVTGGDCVHEVRQGENLFRLSLRYGIPIRTIANASGIVNPDVISVGQRLTLPGCSTTGVFPPPTTTPPIAGDTGFGGTVASAGGIRHTVEQGETLFQISLRYGVPVASIAAANGISNVNYIRFNQILVIP